VCGYLGLAEHDLRLVHLALLALQGCRAPQSLAAFSRGPPRETPAAPGYIGPGVAVTHSFRRKFDHIELLPQDPPFGAQVVAELGVRGLNCGSARKLFRNCVNSDHLHIADAEGRTTERGRLAHMDGDFYYLEHDGAESFPFEDETFEWVFAEHFIEHLPLESTVDWLREMRRLLRPGGHIRLSTPNLSRYVEGYLDPSGAFFAEHRARLEGVKNFGERGIPDRRAWMVNQIFYMWGHRWIYDFEELRHAATCAGFDPESVRECSYAKGRLEEVSQLDLPGRRDESLYVEIDLA
jgi:predicted SAM-dependent methyltransferase